MAGRTRVCRWLLVAFGALALADGLVLAFRLGAVLDWIGWYAYDPTGGKLLAAALLGFGAGALLAARDPYRHRVMLQSILVFTLSGIALLAYRLLGERPTTPDAAWAILGILTLFFAAFCVCYPRRDE